MTGSAELLADYATSGSDAAFGELAARHMDLVYSAALRIVGNDAALAGDVAQLVFTDLARKARELPPGVVLSGWLYRHTCFTASKMVRSEKRREARERQAVEMQALNEDEAAWQQLAPVLDEAMCQLEQSSRDAIIMRFFERQPLRAVGQALGVTEDTARKRVEHAVAALRKYLLRRGVTLSTLTLATVLSAKAVSAAPAGLALGVATTAAVSAAAATHTSAAIGLTKALAMTTMQKLAVATLVAAALGTTVYEARRVHQTEQKLQSLQRQQPSTDGESRPERHQVKLPSPEGTVKPFDWRQVESADYRQYLANLRAIGCPEKTLRDIILADVNDLYRQRLRAAMPATGRFEYWKPGNPFAQLASEVMTNAQVLAGERRQLVATLLGSQAEQGADNFSTRELYDALNARTLDFLTAEKQTGALDILTQFDARVSNLDKRDREAYKHALAEKDAALLQVLSPEEKFEFDLRKTITADGIRVALRGVDVTEEEFRNLFRLQKEYDDKYGPPLYAPNGPEAAAAHQALEQNLMSVLGQERYQVFWGNKHPRR